MAESKLNKATLAQRILTPLRSPQRASEIVGDLLEEPSVRFWPAVLRVALRLAWRWPAAVAASCVAALLPILLYEETVVPHIERSMHRLAGHNANPPAPWLAWSICFLFASLVLCMLAAFLLVRFGRRGKLAHIAALLAWTACAGTCTLWAPHGIGVDALVCALVVVVLFALGYTRHVLSVAASVVAFTFAYRPLMNLDVRLLQRRVARPDLFAPAVALSLLLSFCVALSVATLLHRRWVSGQTSAEPPEALA